MPRDTLALPMFGREATVRVETVDAEARTIDIVFTTGARVIRRRWEGWDEVREYEEELVVTPEAMRLERMNGGAPFLNSHQSYDLGSVLGAVVEGSVRIEGGKGYAQVRLTSAPDVADMVHRILEKTVRSVSVGYRVHAYEVEKRDGQRDIWRAVDWEPYEVSAVSMPADPGASIRSGAEAPALIPCEIISRGTTAAPAAHTRRLQMENEDQAAATETRAAPAAPVAQTPAPAANPTTDAIRAEERTRTAEILRLCQRHGLDSVVSGGMIERGMTIDQARATVLDHLAANDPAGRTSEAAPAQARQTEDVSYRDAMTEALMHRHNPGSGQISAGAREFRGLSLLEMGRNALERAGVSTRGMSRMELAAASMQQRAGVGYQGTSDFPNILANVANRTLRAAYERTPRTFAAWARRATISDFKPVNRLQLGGAPDLLKVPESAEFKYGTMGEGKETYQLSTYGRIIAFTRQTLINDDLDALTRIPAAFGASAADLESDIVYAILMSNPNMADNVALFHASHGNLGTAAVINEGSLAAAYRAYGQQKGIEGRLISILPRYILVPPGVRSIEARKQVTATTPGSTAEVNTFAGRMEVIEEPRLIPASGQDPWFIASDPSRIDTIEYAYLEGQEGVYTETRMGFEVDGIEIKARHDFAAAAIDHRGLYKNAGAAPA